MEKEQQPSAYQPYSGTDFSVPDNKIDTSEYIFRDCLLHVYEEGRHDNSFSLFSWADLFAGAAISFLGDAIITWFSDKTASIMPHIIIGLALLIPSVILYLRKAQAISDGPLACKKRDDAVDKQIKKLWDNSPVKRPNKRTRANHTQQQ